MSAKLTEPQRAILAEFADVRKYGRAGDRRQEGWAAAQWVAEGCDHYYDTPWVSQRLPGLIKRDFIERGVKGYYRLTDAGRNALRSPSEPLNARTQGVEGGR